MDDGRYTKPPPGELLNEETFESFRKRLLYFAARRLGDWVEAEDVAQETLKRAVEALQAGRVEKPAALPAFLFQTAAHICQHRARSAGREGRALRRFASGRPVGGPSDPPDTLHSLISSERGEEVRRALRKLDEDVRELLTLTYVEALPTMEIARRLGLTEGNVRVKRHRALKQLAEILGVTTGSDRGLKQ